VECHSIVQAVVKFYRGAGKSLARPGRKKLQRQKNIYIYIYSNNIFYASLYIYTHTSIYAIYTLNIYICKYIASKEIFSPSNKIHREVSRAKDLSAPLYSV